MMKKPIAVSTLILSIAIGLSLAGCNPPTEQQYTQLPNPSYISSYIVMGSDIYASVYTQGVTVSIDNGNSWSYLPGVLPNPNVTSLAAIGNTLYVGTFGFGVYETTNLGLTWVQVTIGMPVFDDSIGALATLGNMLFAGCDPGGVFRSTNYGAAWVQDTNGMGNVPINAFTVLGNIIVAASAGEGIYISRDSGATWVQSNTGLTNLNTTSLAVFDSTLYAGTTNTGIFSSSNKGTSWTLISGALSSVNYPVYALASTGTTLYAGTIGGGLLKTTDNGMSWAYPNFSGTPNSNVFALLVYGTSLLIGTDNGFYSIPE